MPLRSTLPVALLVCLAGWPAHAANDSRVLTIGLSRGFGVAAMEKSASLIGAFLQQKLGRPVRSVGFLDADSLSDALAAGTVDLAWMSPAAYVRAAAKAPVTLVRRSKRHGMPFYRSVIFVRKDSPVHRFGDLHGKRIAWGAHDSASGNIVPRAMLLDEKLDLAKLFGDQHEYEDHAEVCNAVYTGTADAGAKFAEERPDLAEPEVDGCLPAFAGKLSAFRIVAKSDPIPNDLVAARAKLDGRIAAQLGIVLEKLAPPDRVLVDGFRCDGFAPVIDADFEPLRRAFKLVSH